MSHPAVGYLVNCYPSVSHSFIRREILALEALGWRVARYSVRRADELVDAGDLAEQQRTLTLLGGGAVPLVFACVRALVCSPQRFFVALQRAVALGRRGSRGVLVHLAYLAEACLLLRWTRTEQITHLHAHFGTNSTTVALLWRELGGGGFSFTAHGPEEFDRPEALALGPKIAAAAFVVAISNFGRSQLWRWCPHEHWGKIRIVRCGVDALFLGAAPTVPPAQPKLCWVGRFTEQKGLPILIEACGLLAKEGIPFVLELGGDGPLRADIERRIVQLGLTPHVHLRGWLSAEQTKALILGSRALVMSSFAEGLPVVLIEALALCRPVIAPVIAGIPELVVSRRNGWLVTPGSVKALARAMRECLAATPEQLQALGREGRRRVGDRHCSETEGARLAHLLSAELARANPCSPPVTETPEPAAMRRSSHARRASPSAV